jgi:transitional endoplasmic reticulum ATPase
MNAAERLRQLISELRAASPHPAPSSAPHTSGSPFAQCLQRLDFEAEQPRPRALVIEGPAGSGKSTLLQRWKAQRSGPVWLVKGSQPLLELETTPAEIWIWEDLDVWLHATSHALETVLSVLQLMHQRRSLLLATARNAEFFPSVLWGAERFQPLCRLSLPSASERLQWFQTESNALQMGDDAQPSQWAARTAGWSWSDLHAWRQDFLWQRTLAPAQSPAQVATASMQQIRVASHPALQTQPLEELPRLVGVEELQQQLLDWADWSLNVPQSLRESGVRLPAGVLLVGAPGSGKTQLVRWVAAQRQLPLLCLQGGVLLSASHPAPLLQDACQLAQQQAPALLLCDDLDLWLPARHEGGSAELLLQFLTELERLHAQHGLLLIATSNRPDRLDEALLRPQRLEDILEIPALRKGDRHKLLAHFLQDLALARNVSVDLLAEETDNFSGAEIEALCQQAVRLALRRAVKQPQAQEILLTRNDFRLALQQLSTDG